MKKEMKPEDIRKAGWVLMIATPAFILGMYWETSVWGLWILGFPMVLLSIPMMAFGVRGLQAHYGRMVGNVPIKLIIVVSGKNIASSGYKFGIDYLAWVSQP